MNSAGICIEFFTWPLMTQTAYIKRVILIEKTSVFFVGNNRYSQINGGGGSKRCVCHGGLRPNFGTFKVLGSSVLGIEHKTFCIAVKCSNKTPWFAINLCSSYI